jgi:hypothetical protein
MKVLLRTVWILSISIIFNFNCFCQAYVYGNIDNYRNKKITIRYGSDGFLIGSFLRINTRTDEKGNFFAEANDLYSLGTYNWIRIGKRIIYFYLEPNDSLLIKIDSKKMLNVEFFGKNSSRSYYCNAYYQDYRTRNSIKNAFFSQRTASTLKNEYDYDILFLEKSKEEYNLDSSFYVYMQEYFKYSYINTLSIDGYDTTFLYKEVVKDFNLQNEILKNNIIYYSSMNGYYRKFLGVNLNFDNIEGLKGAIILADIINEHPFSERLKAYMITYYMMGNKNKEILNSFEFNEIITNYLASSTDKIVKLEIEKMLYYYSKKL